MAAVWPRRRSLAFAGIALLVLCALAAGALREAVARGAPEVPLSALPVEARATLQRIHAGGPFPYSRDGVVFNNREHILPAMPRGYYREFTVPTPGVKTRGGRRIVCGGDVAALSECYYSDDHYQSFRRIRP
jgi:ribonuclease T1